MSSAKNRNADNIGERLRLCRKSLKMNGSDFAKLIGISQGSLSDIETSKTSPSAKTLEGLVRNTDIDIEWLLTGEGPKKLNAQKKFSKFDLLNEFEEWLSEEVKKKPSRKEWFEIQLLDSFQAFKEWKEEREGKGNHETDTQAYKVA